MARRGRGARTANEPIVMVKVPKRTVGRTGNQALCEGLVWSSFWGWNGLFDAWLRDMKRWPLVALPVVLTACIDKADLPRPVAQGDPDHGLSIIRETGCAACHKIPGVAWPEGRSGSNLAGFGARPLIAGRLPNQPNVLLVWLIDAPSLDPDTGMPPTGLNQHQARDVAAYLYTLDDD